MSLHIVLLQIMCIINFLSSCVIRTFILESNSSGGQSNICKSHMYWG